MESFQVKRKILQRGSHRERRVDTVQSSVAGLTIDSTGTPGEVNISHGRSGLAVVLSVPEHLVGGAEEILGRLAWGLDVFEIFDSDAHFDAVTEVDSLLTNKERSTLQEGRVAADLGGKIRPGSGSVWGYRRDVVTPTLLIECKTTRRPSFPILSKDMEFLATQAAMAGKIPAYIVSFEAPNPFDVVFLPESNITAELTIQSSADLPVTINAKRAWYGDLVIKGVSYRYSDTRSSWLVMDYERFLLAVKKEEVCG
jgi:hypothetical protein